MQVEPFDGAQLRRETSARVSMLQVRASIGDEREGIGVCAT